MIDFRTPPAPLGPRERLLLWTATVVVAVTRLLALAKGPWDWDEMLFLLALRDYDVALHHPHPPGFPLYVLAARGFMAMGWDPFHALQSVNLACAIFIVPAMVLLCRELRLPFATSLAAAVLFAFLPNVWFFGGTAFSDVAAIVLAVAACGLLLRGARSGSALIAGALLLAVAAGFRPQNLLVGCVPALIGSWHQMRQRKFGTVFAAAAAGFAIVAASYAGAVMATGEWWQYRDALIAHQQYLAAVDSFRSPDRPSLPRISDDFFVRPFRFPAMNVALSMLAGISLIAAVVKRRTSVLLALALFGPFSILAWLTLDFHSASRFSIGYMPLLAIFAGDGVALIARYAGREPKRERLIIAAATLLLAGSMLVWTWPAVMRVRRELSPPMQAVAFIRERYPDRKTALYVQKRLRPYTEYYLSDFRLIQLEDDLPRGAAQQPGLYLREGVSRAAGATNLSWPRERLWGLVRRRYFDVSVTPLPLS